MISKRSKSNSETRVDLIGSQEFSSLEENAYFHTSRMSVVILITLRITDAVEYGLIMPSLYRYLELMPDINESNKAHFYGIVLSSFSLSSLIMKLVLGRYSDVRGFREAFIITIILAIGGNILYSMAYYLGSVYYALAGRILSGIGAANTSLTFPYVARTLAPEKRTEVMLLLSLGFPFGMVLGPATNILTNNISFTYNGFQVDECNSPALVVAIFLIILFISLVTFLVEPPAYSKEQNSSSEGCGEVCKQSVEIRAFTCMFTVMGVNFMISTIEGLIVPITHSAFGWHPLQNSYVYCSIAVEILLLTLIIKVALKCLSDTNMVLFAHVFFFSGLACAYMLWTYDMPVWHYLVATFVVLAGIPFTFAPNRSRFTKLIEGSVHQGTLSAFVSLFASLGSILGPLWLGVTVGHPTDNGPVAHITILGVIGCTFMMFVLNIIGWTCGKPLEKRDLFLLQNDIDQNWDDISTDVLERVVRADLDDIRKEILRRKTLEDHTITS